MEGTGGSGGASALSGGLLYLGRRDGDSAGLRDLRQFRRDVQLPRGGIGPGADEEKIGLYCEQSVEHFDWLVELGVPFMSKFLPLPHLITPPDVGLVWLGENSYPFCDVAVPAPRGHRPAAEGLRGWLLMSDWPSPWPPPVSRC